jgi:hypothetical protein
MIARNTLQSGASVDVSNARSLGINTRSHLPNTRSLFQVREALMIARDALRSGDSFDVGNAAEEAGVYDVHVQSTGSERLAAKANLNPKP